MQIPYCNNNLFNSRTHGGRDDCRNLTTKEMVKFQFTRPRGARHMFVRLKSFVAAVSIHAPTGGATNPV